MPLVEKTKPTSMQKCKTLVIKTYMEGQRMIIASANIGVARKLSYLLIQAVSFLRPLRITLFKHYLFNDFQIHNVQLYMVQDLIKSLKLIYIIS